MINSYKFFSNNKFHLILFFIIELSSVFSICYFFKDTPIGLLFAFTILNMFFILFAIRSWLLEKSNSLTNLEKQSYDILSTSYDNIREFKHDFSNIMQSIGGYLVADDLNGLKSYYSSIFKECSELKQLAALNKDVFNSPPILALITEKYYKAKKLGIEFNIESLIDFNTLHMDIYEFTRILGIFLDNSIEAASSSDKKIINILIYKDATNHFDSILIENSCNGDSIDTTKIFNKDFSTKPKNMGIGLWKVKKILKHYDNIFLNTSVDNNLFKHQLRIYY